MKQTEWKEMNATGDRTAFDHGTQVNMPGDEFYEKAAVARDNVDNELVEAHLLDESIPF